MSESPLKRVALIGLGRMASWIEVEAPGTGVCSHASAIRGVSGLHLSSGCDPSAKAREAFSQRWDGVVTYETVQDLFAHENPDVIVIASPPALHLEHVLAALSAKSVQTIVCEKPLALQSGECRKIERFLLHFPDKRFFVNHSRRWGAVYQKAREWISDGAIGPIRRAHAWYGRGIYNIGTHLIDALRFLFAEISVVRASAESGNPEDPDIDGVLQSESGFEVSIQTNSSASFLLFEIEILGGEGLVRISNNGEEARLFRPEKQGGLLQLEEIFARPAGEQPLVTLYQEVCKEHVSPRCDARDGSIAVQAADALLHSVRHGKREVSVFGLGGTASDAL